MTTLKAQLTYLGILLAILTVIQTGDIITTYYAIGHQTEYESNPAMAAVLEENGYLGLTISKLLSLTVVTLTMVGMLWWNQHKQLKPETKPWHKLRTWTHHNLHHIIYIDMHISNTMMLLVVAGNAWAILGIHELLPGTTITHYLLALALLITLTLTAYTFLIRKLSKHFKPRKQTPTMTLREKIDKVIEQHETRRGPINIKW